MGSVSKKWEGLATIAKALFTSADTYGVTINPGAAKDRSAKILLLAAALAIDVVYRESGKR